MLKKYLSDLKREFSGYNAKGFSRDLMAGLTVAAVALPLALAFGVSSGADAASGLITAIVAGLVIGLLSGASYQISGPTGAMSAILVTVSARFGLQGVLTAGLLSGVLLLILALLRVGRLVSFLPAPVITGFTSGIAVIIALGQVDNLFGTVSQGENAIAKLLSYGSLGFAPNWWAVGFGVAVILIMVLYPKKWNSVFPSSLAALIVAVAANFFLNQDAAASTVKEVGVIPQTLISPQSLLFTGLDLAHWQQLLAPAFSIAILGMIESLLCGAAAGKMKHEKMDAGRELVAQGIGNILIPLFGGVPATAAIARTSVVIKSGGQTRLASVIHSITLILSMFLLGGVMSRIPLAALAGVLMVTAWRMNEWSAIRQMFRQKRWPAILQFLITMLATVIFDLTVAILIGLAVAMLLFILKSCDLTIEMRDVEADRLPDGVTARSDIKVVYLSGPLFFGTQERLTRCLPELIASRAVIFSMRGVPTVDDSAIAELDSLRTECEAQGTHLFFCGLQPKVQDSLKQSGFMERTGSHRFCWDAIEAFERIEAAAENQA